MGYKEYLLGSKEWALKEVRIYGRRVQVERESRTTEGDFNAVRGRAQTQGSLQITSATPTVAGVQLFEIG
jgi:hypothetical protein